MSRLIEKSTRAQLVTRVNGRAGRITAKPPMKLLTLFKG